MKGNDSGRRASAEPALVASLPEPLSGGSALSGDGQAQEVFGIECEHHYGITTHPLPSDGDVAREVYRLIREAWHAPKGSEYDVLDENHTWEAVLEASPRWSRIVIRKNERSPRFVFKPWWCDDGPGTVWFSQAFRVATRADIEREIADKLGWAARWEETATRQRDSIRGRKWRSKYLRYAETSRREAEIIASRWPQFAGVERTVWQSRLHQHRDERAAA